MPDKNNSEISEMNDNNKRSKRRTDLAPKDFNSKAEKELEENRVKGLVIKV